MLKIPGEKNKILVFSFLFSLVMMGVLFLFSDNATAQQNTRTLDVSAYILNRENKKIDNGKYQVRFAIYGSETGGVAVWQETREVEIVDGVLNVYLGEVNPLPETLDFGNADYFLGIKIGDDSEASPRKKIGFVPAALNALSAESLQGAKIGTKKGDILQLGKKGKIDLKRLPTGTGNKKLILGNDSRLHKQNTDTGTDSTTFNIGDGTALTAGNFDLTVSSETNKPTLRFSYASQAWQYSTDGINFTNIGVVDVATTGTTTLTASNSGLEISDDGLRLLGGCSAGQILTWNATEAEWQCTDNTAGSSNWTETGTLTYLTDASNDFAIGGSSQSNSAFYWDVSSGAFQINPYGTSFGNTGEMRFLELASNGTNYVGLKAPDSISSNQIWTLPASDGSANQVLTTDGSGQLQWLTAGAGLGAPIASQYVTLALDSGLDAERVLTGTSNQIIITDGGANGNVTLSTPQDIATTSSPTFAGVTLSGLTSGSVVFAGIGGAISEDNSNFFWDDTNNRLGIGTASPDDAIEVYQGNIKIGDDSNAIYGVTFERAGSVIGTINTSGGLLTITPNYGGRISVMGNISIDGGADRGIIFNEYGGDTDYWLSRIDTDGDAGTDNDVFQIGEGTTIGANPLFTIDNAGNIGIGTTTPSQQLEITQNMELADTTYASQYGIIYKNGTPFIHNFNYGDNGTVTTDGHNLFIGKNAGNFTMGSTATSTSHSSYNVGIGGDVLANNTNGSRNVAVGYNSLQANTTGGNNTAIGERSMYSNITGNRNTSIGEISLRYFDSDDTVAVGYAAMGNATAGNRSVSIGAFSLVSNTTGSRNVGVGFRSLNSNTNGSYNIALGYQSGYYIADGSTGNTTGDYNVFIGANTKAYADNDQNEIVIGYNATGAGSNSIVLGNDDITTTVLAGDIGIRMAVPSSPTATAGAGGTLNGTYYYKVSASDGTGWTDVSSEVSATVDGGTTNGTITIAWTASTGATNYRVWRGTASDSQTEYYETTSTSLADDGSITFTAGTPPTTTTAYVNKLADSGDSWLLGGNLGLGDVTPSANLVVGDDSSITYADGSGDAYIQNDLEVDGTIYGTISGTINPGFTQGSVAFMGVSGLAEDNSNLFWDDTNNRLGIGTASPTEMLEIYGTSNTLKLSYDATNYATLATDSAGALVMSGTGTSGSKMTIGTGLAEDTSIIYDGNAQDYYIGLDDTDDALKIGLGSTVGTTPYITVLSSGSVGIGDATPASLFTVGDGDLFQINSSGQVVAGTWNGTLIGTTYGGTGTATTFTQGSMIFAGASGVYSQDNSNLFWDDTNNRLGIGTASPTEMLEIYGTSNTLKLSYDATNYATLSTNSSGELSFSSSSVTDSALVIGTGLAEDTLIIYDGNAQDYHIGLDDTDDVFKIGLGSSLGTTDYLTINSSGYVGIGTASPSQQLEITQNMELADTTYASQYGIIYKNGTPFIHNFNYGDNGTVTTAGHNLFIGKNAGNFTMGSTAVSSYQSSLNVFIGYSSGYFNTTGYANSFVGNQSGHANTTGNANSFLGNQSGYANTTGSGNSFVGYLAGYANTTGIRNIAFGYNAGRYIADGSTGNATGSYNLFLGSSTKALADGDTNEIVIGYNATGIGSNSVVLGNDSITTTALKGNVGIGTTSPTVSLSIKSTSIGFITLDRTDSIGVDEVAYVGVGYSSPLTDYLYLGTGINDDDRKFVLEFDSGNVGIGTTNPNEKLEIDYGNLRMNQEPSPGAPTVAVNASAGNLTGTYRYRITFVTADGETSAGSYSASVSPSGEQVDLSAIPVGSSKVIARKIYRTVADASWPYNVQLVTTISDNTTTTYTDNLADASLGEYAPGNNTTGSNFYTNGIKIGEADSGVTIWGYNAGRVNAGYSNSFVGAYAGYSNTTGNSNSLIGYSAGYSNTTGSYNSFMGRNAGYSNTTGYSNSFMGAYAGYSNTTGNSNSFMGRNAGYSNTTGSYNSFMGRNAGYSNTTGNYNSFVGQGAGRYIADGSTGNATGSYNLFLGSSTKALADGDTNEIVIGYNATGIGSNSVVLGNDSITTTALKGNVGIGTTTPTALLHLDGIAGTVGLEINSNEITSTNNVLMLRSDVSSDDDAVFRVQADGAVYADGAYTGTGADYAEYFYTQDTDLSAGEAVCIDTTKENAVKRCQNSADTNIMGIVSSHPSVVGNGGKDENGVEKSKSENYVIVGMLGQIPAKVTDENGAIMIGDSLTSASEPGYLRKADAGEATVGIALENSLTGNNTIQVMISRKNKSLTVENVEQSVQERIKDMEIEDQVNRIIANGDWMLETNARLSALEDAKNGNGLLVAELQNQIDDIKSQLGSAGDDVTSGIGILGDIAMLKESNQTLIEFMLAMDGDKFIKKNDDGNLLLDGKLKAKVTETGALVIAVADDKKATIGEGKICGIVPVDEDNDHIDDCSGNPIPYDSDNDGKDDETGDKMPVDKNGDWIDDATEKPIVNDGRTAIVETKAVDKNSKIFITSKSLTDQTLSVTKITSGKSFKVEIKDPTKEEINFDWWIVEKGEVE